MNPYRDKLLGLQLIPRGRRGVVERVRAVDPGRGGNSRVRELHDPETGTSVYHHSNDDARQDVTLRPAPIDVAVDIPLDRLVTELRKGRPA